jgi:hypothetical protein
MGLRNRGRARHQDSIVLTAAAAVPSATAPR